MKTPNLLKTILLSLAIILVPSCFANADQYNGNDPINWNEVIANATGTTYIVSTESEFNSRAASAQPGDMVLVTDGIHNGWALNIPSNGTEANPIIYTAQNPGQVTFQGGVKLFWISGDYNVMGGFNINNVGSDVIRFHSQASYNRLTDNKMNDLGSLTSGRGLSIPESNHIIIELTITKLLGQKMQ